MTALAVTTTILAIVCSVLVVFANSMRSSPGKFGGGSLLAAVWVGAFAAWLAWGFA